MFLNIIANNFICFYKIALNTNDIDIVNDEFYINLLSIDEISIRQCISKVNRNNKVLELKYQIKFDRFVEEGVLNYITLFFKDKQDKEFKRIKRIIKNNTYKEYKMGKNHKSDIKNSNKGTKGTNKTYDKNQGNRGKQLNPNKKGKS
jgi:hypothetical protein